MSKKSFILHLDSLDVIDELNDQQIAELFKAIIDFQKTGKTNLKGLMKVVFIPFKNQFLRDNNKYDSKCETNKINGSKGGRPKLTQDNPTKPKLTQRLNGKPKKPYNDNDSDSDSKNDSDNKNDSVNDNVNKKDNVKDINLVIYKAKTYEDILLAEDITDRLKLHIIAKKRVENNLSRNLESSFKYAYEKYFNHLNINSLKYNSSTLNIGGKIIEL